MATCAAGSQLSCGCMTSPTLINAGATIRLAARSWTTDGAFVDKAGVPLSDHLPVVVQFDWSSTPVPSQATIEAPSKPLATLRSRRVDTPNASR